MEKRNKKKISEIKKQIRYLEKQIKSCELSKDIVLEIIDLENQLEDLENK